MAARAIAQVDINLGMVNVAVSAFAASESAASISFNQLHGECRTRIQQKKWCPCCEREVSSTEIVKGYEFEKGKYITVTEEEIEQIQPETSRSIAITSAVPLADIDPLYFDRPYYLTAQSAASAQSFAIIREAMSRTGRCLIGVWTIYNRDNLVAIRPRGNGLVLHILHEGSEIRKQEEIAGHSLTEGVTVDKRMLSLAEQLMATFSDDFDPAVYEGEYKRELQALVDAKVGGHEIQKKPEKKAPATLDFMAALEASLAAGKPTKKAKTAKVESVAIPKKEKARKTA